MEYVSLQQWLLTFLLFGVILALEIIHALRNPHQPTIRSAGTWSVIYIVAALLFAFVVQALWDKDLAVEYITGYVTERALSMDNLFVFILIITAFAVPRHLQQIVMLAGVGIAIVLRAIFIYLGAAIIERFSWIFYVFGVFLLVTAWRLIQPSDQPEDEEYEDNAFVRSVRRLIPVTQGWEGTRIWIRRNGVFMLTPLALVMMAVGSTDLLFAFDSIPAIFGITNEPYIVFTANAWALMGMVQLYFLLGGLLERLVYLSFGLAFVLALIGVKLVIHAMHANALPFLNDGQPITMIPEISTLMSLGLIVVALVVAGVASVIKTRDDEKVPAEP